MWLWLPPDLHDQLLRYAAADYDSVAHLVRVAVARYLSARGEQQPGAGPLPVPGRPRDVERTV